MNYRFIAGVITVIGLLLDNVVFAVQAAKVRFSYSSRSNFNAPFQVASNKGFFAEEGSDVEMIQVNPRLGGTALLNGELDFSTTFGTTLRGIVSGFPPVDEVRDSKLLREVQKELKLR